ncbi:uncharacterized protein LOC110621543 [Manihot esculenta]|uniref:uncharacterized protein LOC110621543 n=1 Tax=Manihot esculenta TaxID=3983 RepID=UPI000B5D8691|nr:uncharacterized protein LOC110621543 [Manihot esculenta]
MVDFMVGFDYLSSLDAMSGYHQISIDKSDEEKTSFITEDGTYCYKAMLFRLKNARATYQHLMNKIFKDQIGRNVEVYFNYMMIAKRPSKALRSISAPHMYSVVPWRGEKLLIYLAALEQAMSALLVREEARIQKSVFWVSKVLKDAEVKYMNIEKLAFTLLLAMRKFRIYLKDHQGVVLTDQPLKKILHRLENSRQMLAWSIEISLYCLIYQPRTAIKA